MFVAAEHQASVGPDQLVVTLVRMIRAWERKGNGYGLYVARIPDEQLRDIALVLHEEIFAPRRRQRVMTTETDHAKL